MKSKLLIFLLVIFCCMIQGYGQNIIKNPSFEESKNSNFPTNFSEANLLQDWSIVDSPDWYYGDFKGDYESGNPPVWLKLNAHSGLGYIGFGPCEAVYSKLEKKLQQNDQATLSFWMSPQQKKDTEINIYFFKNSPSTWDRKVCLNPVSNFVNHIKIDVLSESIHNPGTWYPFFIPFVANGDINYILIKGENIGGWLGSKEYVYVDDLILTSCCNNSPVTCSRTYGCPLPESNNTHWACCATDQNCAPNNYLKFWNLDNVRRAEVYIYNLNAQLLRAFGAISENGITNPLYWDGKDMYGNELAPGTYFYQLYVWNDCVQGEKFTKSFNKTHFGNCPSAPPPCLYL